jgi:hypothetical protein
MVWPFLVCLSRTWSAHFWSASADYGLAISGLPQPNMVCPFLACLSRTCSGHFWSVSPEPGLDMSDRLCARQVATLGGALEEEGDADETVVDDFRQAHKAEAHAQPCKCGTFVTWCNIFSLHVQNF